MFKTANHQHHHIVPLARISLTLSRHFSLSFIASGRSSGLHPVSSHSCCMYVRAGRPAFARPYVGVHWSTSLMSLSLIGIILRWGFLIWELIFIYCGLFVLILVVFVLFLLSLRFGQISPLAFCRWFTATSDRNAESCNRIHSNYCLP